MDVDAAFFLRFSPGAAVAFAATDVRDAALDVRLVDCSFLAMNGQEPLDYNGCAA